MKILLIDSSIDKFLFCNPISILDLASYLRAYGFDVDVCKYNNLSCKEYDIVGLSSICSFGGASMNILKTLKNTYHKSKIIVGGKWASSMHPYEVDEITFMGIEIVQKSGELYFTNKEIDYVNYPSWSKEDIDKMCEGNYIMSSRGCPFKCHFCNNTEKKVEYFSPQRTSDIIASILPKAKTVFFVDDVFISSVDNMKLVLEECNKRGVNIKGKNSFFVHVNFINDSVIDMIKEYQPIEVQIGIESGDERMLKEMGKGISIDNIKNKVNLLSKITRVRGLWLLGFPGENEDSLVNTTNLLYSLKGSLSSNWFSFYQPVYNTVGYQKCMQEGGEICQAFTNEDITYVTPNVTKEMLVKYKQKMIGLT